MTDPATLLALSPLDGRYAAKLDALRPIFSEYGLMRERVHVEIEWLIHLLDGAVLPGAPRLSEEERDYLRALPRDFSDAQIARLAEIADKTPVTLALKAGMTIETEIVPSLPDETPEQLDQRLDEALDESFPASDPPSVSPRSDE